jgi:hypothetical protein
MAVCISSGARCCVAHDQFVTTACVLEGYISRVLLGRRESGVACVAVVVYPVFVASIQ